MDCLNMFWWVQPVLTFLGLIIGALLVVWQIRIQFKNSNTLNKMNMRNELYLKIYNELSPEIEETFDCLSSSITHIMSIPNKFSNRNLIQSFLDKHNLKTNNLLKTLQSNVSMPPLVTDPIDERANTMIEIHDRAQKKVIHMIGKIESYEIVFLDFNKILKALSNGLEKMGTNFTNFFNETVMYLPSDVPSDKIDKIGKKVIDHKPPNDKEIELLQELSYKYLDACSLLIGNIQDLRIALQNRLLGQIFDTRVPLRKPRDPNINIADLDEKSK